MFPSVYWKKENIQAYKYTYIHTHTYMYTYIHTQTYKQASLFYEHIPSSLSVQPSLFPTPLAEFNTFFIWSQIRLSAAVHAGFNPRLFDSRRFIADGVWWSLFSLYITNFTRVIKENWGYRRGYYKSAKAWITEPFPFPFSSNKPPSPRPAVRNKNSCNTSVAVGVFIIPYSFWTVSFNLQPNTIFH